MTVFQGSQFNVKHFVSSEILLTIEFDDEEMLLSTDGDRVDIAQRIVEVFNSVFQRFYEEHPDENDLYGLTLEFDEEKYGFGDNEMLQEGLTVPGKFDNRIPQQFFLAFPSPPDSQGRFNAVIPARLDVDSGTDGDNRLGYYVRYWYAHNEEIAEILPEYIREYESPSFKILSVAPEMFCSTSSNSAAEGGPGTYPNDSDIDGIPDPRFTIIENPCNDDADCVAAYTTLENAYKNRKSDGRAEVRVILLDSSYDKITLSEKLLAWDTGGNRLATELGAANPTVLDFTNFITAADVGIVTHCYDMKDHGTFSASIINELAPQADIYLFRVLNDLGVGTATSIMMGLLSIFDIADPHIPTIVNMSLGFELTPSVKNFIDAWVDIVTTIKIPGMDAEHNETEVEHPVLDLQFVMWLLRSVTNLVQFALNPGAYDIIFIAASGNDGLYSANDIDPCDRTTLAQKIFPAARYPAAYDGVIGVGALYHMQSPALYSNGADREGNITEGFFAFGGDNEWNIGSAESEADRRLGMLSLYMADQIVESGADNTHGYAMWCGTSFATALVSGTYAMILAEGGDPDTVLNALQPQQQPSEPPQPRGLPVIPAYS